MGHLFGWLVGQYSQLRYTYLLARKEWFKLLTVIVGEIELEWKTKGEEYEVKKVEIITTTETVIHMQL